MRVIINIAHSCCSYDFILPAQHGRWAFKTGKFSSFFVLNRRISFFFGGWSLFYFDFCLPAAAIISLFKFIDTNACSIVKLPPLNHRPACC
jgi:hypothetical protein